MQLGKSTRFIGLLILSWVVMTTTHELGHLLGGWWGGATLTQWDLAPWRLPYSLHQPDPHPLLTLWAGPVLAAVVPFGAAMIYQRSWIRFVADFCLLANGIYLAVAWFSGDRFLDTPRLLHAGAWPVSIVGYCCATIGWGYFRFRADCLEVFS